MTESKPGTGSLPKTAFNARAKFKPPDARARKPALPWQPVVIGCLLACSTLACVVPMLGPTDPIYTPPVAQAYLTASPPAAVTLAAETSATPVPPTPTLADSPTPEPTATNPPPRLYYTQAGDTLQMVAIRFGVEADEIVASPPQELPLTTLLNPDQLLIIPDRLDNTTAATHLMPDSEVVFSPSAMDFDIQGFVQQAGGHLSQYREYLASTGWTDGADIIWRVATENSINPRLLLALLEYQSGWVYGDPFDMLHEDYPFGHVDAQRKGLYAQLVWAVNQLSVGYYGWREGLLSEIVFSDGVKARLAPELNAGTVALQSYFVNSYDSVGWLKALDVQTGLPALHERMFGNAWLRAQTVEPLFPPELTQPHLTLPFFIGQLWSYTGGPHGAWERDGARAALDFSPARTESGCVESDAWVIAAAPGIVTRSGHGVLVTDLDGDGHEQTGWVLVYLHLKMPNAIKPGTLVEAGDLLGHPSCEGGISTGTHLHIARKYNGEWMPAAGPVPFVMGGWTPHAGEKPYAGTLTREGELITASPVGSFESRITRGQDDP
jgi:murein DD-endopeptidase MepM/ murein hydrolase activator NlpD